MANPTEMKRLLTSLLLAILMTLPVKAEKWALLVGINDYPNDISPLRYCVADVEAFRQALVNVAGFKEDKIFLMTDQMRGQMEPTNINVIKRLGILSKQIKADDTFVFYFSGHGIVNDESSFLLAANSDTATVDTLELSAIPLDRVSKILSTVKAQQLLTVIDACRNNPETGRSNQDNLLSDNFTRGFKIRRSSSNSGNPSVSATLYACNVGERAYEWAEKGHGVFSYYLLEGLNGEAVNSQGEVTVTGLAEYTQSHVVKWAEEFRGKKQTPWLSLQGGAKLVLAEGVVKSSIPSAIPIINAEAEMWSLIRDSTNIADFKEFINIFPSGQLSDLARFKLNRLRQPTEKLVPNSTKPSLRASYPDVQWNSIERFLGMERWYDRHVRIGIEKGLSYEERFEYSMDQAVDFGKIINNDLIRMRVLPITYGVLLLGAYQSAFKGEPWSEYDKSFVITFLSLGGGIYYLQHFHMKHIRAHKNLKAY